MDQLTDRRHFLAAAAALGAAATAGGSRASAQHSGSPLQHSTQPRRLLKTLKIGMVKAEGGLAEKFKVAKAAGYDGIELDSPGFDVDEARRAIDQSGLPVDGTVCSTHWSIATPVPTRPCGRGPWPTCRPPSDIPT